MKISSQNLLSHRVLLWSEDPDDQIKALFFYPDLSEVQVHSTTAEADWAPTSGARHENWNAFASLGPWVVQGPFKCEPQSICIHLIWLHPHYCISSAVVLAKENGKILQRHWQSLDIQSGLGRRAKYLIKIKLTLYCCTDKGKYARNWLGMEDTSCPSWMGGCIDGWMDRYSTTYSHNWI